MRCGRVLREQADAPAHAAAILVGLEAGGVNAVNGELFVAVLGIAGNADGADDLAVVVADQHAAALGEDLIVAG